MTDLVMDLRGQTNRDDEMSLKTKSLLEEAADEIECLRSDRALQADKIREMADERDDLLKQLVYARKAIADIKQATIDGRVCDDVAWFDTITTLHDFCDMTLDHLTDDLVKP